MPSLAQSAPDAPGIQGRTSIQAGARSGIRRKHSGPRRVRAQARGDGPSLGPRRPSRGGPQPRRAGRDVAALPPRRGPAARAGGTGLARGMGDDVGSGGGNAGMRWRGGRGGRVRGLNGWRRLRRRR